MNKRELFKRFLLYSFAMMFLLAVGCSGGGGGGDSSGDETNNTSDQDTSDQNTNEEFPIGTWDAGKWGSFTVLKLEQTIGTTMYFSGSVSYSTFGTIDVSGSRTGGNVITLDGDLFQVLVQDYGDSNPTVYHFSTTVDQLHGGNAVGAYIWGDLIITTFEIGASYSGDYPFTKTQ